MARFEKYIAEEQHLWDTMKIVRDGPELQRVANKINKYKDVYQKVEKDTGVPWQMVAVIHLREAGESDIGRFKGVLHNGEKIVGTGRKTHLVPSGRGPFADWNSAAVDALRLEGFTGMKDWTPGKMLAALEPFNGYGYRTKGLRSPYLWASTNHQQRGKYVADGVFNPNVMDTQVGCAAQLKYLGVGAVATKVPVPVVVPGIVAAGGGSIWQWGMKAVPFVIGALAIAALIYWYKHRKNTDVVSQ